MLVAWQPLNRAARQRRRAFALSILAGLYAAGFAARLALHFTTGAFPQ